MEWRGQDETSGKRAGRFGLAKRSKAAVADMKFYILNIFLLKTASLQMKSEARPRNPLKFYDGLLFSYPLNRIRSTFFLTDKGRLHAV